MALYTRKEFAELLGLSWNKDTRAKIATWANEKRQNILMSGEYIDDSIEPNKSWIAKQQTRKVSIEEAKEPKPVKHKIKNIEQPDEVKVHVGNLDVALKQKNLEKLTVDTRLHELKEQKIRGEVVPIELMKGMFITHNQSILTSYKDALEEMLINISVEAKLSGEQLARLRGKMITSLNSAIKRAKDSTAHDLKRLIEEFSIKREIGEHE